MKRDVYLCDICLTEPALVHIPLNGKVLAVCSGSCFLIACERYYQDTVIAAGKKEAEPKKIGRIVK